MGAPLHRTDGLSLIELLVVTVIVGILAAVAMARFIPVAEEAVTTQAQGISGALGSAIALAHGKWVSQGGGASVDMAGTIVDVNAAGWPSDPSAPPLTQATCSDLWRELMRDAPPVQPGFTPGGPDWGALAGGALCGWVYQPDPAPIRIVIYNSVTGSVQLFVI